MRAHAGVELGLAAVRTLLRRTAARGFHRARHGCVLEDETRDGRGTGSEPRVGDSARRALRGGATMRVLRRGVCHAPGGVRRPRPRTEAPPPPNRTGGPTTRVVVSAQRASGGFLVQHSKHGARPESTTLSASAIAAVHSRARDETRGGARRGRAPSAPARPPHVRPRVVRPRHSRARHLRGHSTRARRGHALATSASRRLLRRGGRRGYPREDRASHQPPVPRLRDPPRRRRVARALVVRVPRRVGLGPKQVPSGGVRRRGLRRGVFPAHAQAPEKRLRIPQDDPEGGATRHARTDGALHRKFHLQAAHVRGGGRDGGRAREDQRARGRRGRAVRRATRVGHEGELSLVLRGARARRVGRARTPGHLRRGRGGRRGGRGGRRGGRRGRRRVVLFVPLFVLLFVLLSVACSVS